MLTRPASPEMIREWKRIYEENRARLTANRKTGAELLAYLNAHYSLVPINTEEANSVVAENVMRNEPLREKLPQGMLPEPVTYSVAGTGIFIGIDLVTGYFCVEGSEALYDELFAYRGLDERDLENFYLAAEYVECARRFPQLT